MDTDSAGLSHFEGDDIHIHTPYREIYWQKTLAYPCFSQKAIRVHKICSILFSSFQKLRTKACFTLVSVLFTPAGGKAS